MDKLKALRELERLTAAEMADKLGMSKSLYTKLESGARTPSINAIRKIKDVYPEIDINIFFD